MPRVAKKTEQDATPEVAPVVLPADAAVSVYKDRAGKALGGGISEGKANFAAITEAARAMVATVPTEQPKPAA